MKRSVIFLFLLLSFTFQAASQSLEEKLAEIDAYAKTVMTTHTNSAGMAIAVVKDDKVVFAKGYGTREIGETPQVYGN